MLEHTHVYTNMADAYKSIPLPYLGKSDHVSLFLLPKYAPHIIRVKPRERTVKIWPEGAKAKLQGCFKNHDWSQHSSEATLDSHAPPLFWTI